MVVIFLDFLVFDQIFLSPQLKWSVIISTHFFYKQLNIFGQAFSCLS